MLSFDCILRLFNIIFQSVRELRRANILGNKKLGRNAGYGWAVDDLLRLQHADEVKKKKQRDRSNGLEIDEGDEEDEDDMKSPNRKKTSKADEATATSPIHPAKRLDKNKVLSRSDIKAYATLDVNTSSATRDRRARRDGVVDGDGAEDGEAAAP